MGQGQILIGHKGSTEHAQAAITDLQKKWPEGKFSQKPSGNHSHQVVMEGQPESTHVLQQMRDVVAAARTEPRTETEPLKTSLG